MEAGASPHRSRSPGIAYPFCLAKPGLCQVSIDCKGYITEYLVCSFYCCLQLRLQECSRYALGGFLRSRVGSWGPPLAVRAFIAFNR